MHINPLFRYKGCKVNELATFAQNRDLHVTSISRRRDGAPKKSDYIQALEAADQKPFRFLDLTPEDRNRVYQELLVVHDSYTCEPQFLATCRQTHDEATGILYCDNLVEIKLRPNTTGHLHDWLAIFVDTHGENAASSHLYQEHCAS